MDRDDEIGPNSVPSPSPQSELAASVARREQAEGVVLARARAFRVALEDANLPRRAVADALDRLTDADEELEAAEQTERAIRAALGPRELTEDEQLKARTWALQDLADANGRSA